MIDKKRLFVICVVVSAIVFSIGGNAQNINDCSKAAIVLRITQPNGNWVRACVIEGGMLRMTGVTTGETFAFLPTTKKTKDDIVNVTIYQVKKSAHGDDFSRIDSVEMTLESTRTLTTPSLVIELEAVLSDVAFLNRAVEQNRPEQKAKQPDKPEGKKPSKPEEKPKQPDSVEGTSTDHTGGCCVSCGGVTWCSNCSVVAACASCCTGPCSEDCGGH